MILSTETGETAQWRIQVVTMDYSYDYGYTTCSNPTASDPLKVNVIISAEAKELAMWKTFEAAECWSNYCDNVVVQVWAYNDTIPADADVTVNVVRVDDVRISAETIIYNSQKEKLSGSALNCTWPSVFKIALYTGFSESFSELSEISKRKTFIHEVGHALKLMHPNEAHAFSGYVPASIMCETEAFQQSYDTSRVMQAPSGHDKAALNHKWG